MVQKIMVLLDIALMCSKTSKSIPFGKGKTFQDIKYNGIHTKLFVSFQFFCDNKRATEARHDKIWKWITNISSYFV
jgi:hypothetical protein